MATATIRTAALRQTPLDRRGEIQGAVETQVRAGLAPRPCLECEKAIGIRRLRALPFAVRCHECEGQREAQERSASRQAQPAGRTAFFADLP